MAEKAVEVSEAVSKIRVPATEPAPPEPDIVLEPDSSSPDPVVEEPTSTEPTESENGDQE